RSRDDIVLNVASSGIAALLLPDGRTAHCRFCIPINVDEYSTCTIHPNNHLAQLIAKARLIIWDEAPMMHKYCFEAIDRTLRDILTPYDERNKHIPFGGKVVVFGGDFRQILPVIPKGTRQAVVNASINSSRIWHHCEVLTLITNMRLLYGSVGQDLHERKMFSYWVLGIGDGSIGDIDDGDINLRIPDDILIQRSDDPIVSIVTAIYPSIIDNMKDPTFFQDRAILTPKNSIVDLINEYMLSLIDGEDKVYLSYDSPENDSSGFDRPDDIYTPEFLNTITCSGLPNHKLKLKV
ncbi:ATP-dependent DNA helicase PIF1, partial [Trifolium pratense]